MPKTVRKALAATIATVSMLAAAPASAAQILEFYQNGQIVGVFVYTDGWVFCSSTGYSTAEYIHYDYSGIFPASSCTP